MTVAEYLAASRGRRLHYRLVRNPFVLFVIAPFFVFVVKQRFASAVSRGVQYRSVWWTNLSLLCMAAALSWIYGFGPYVLIQAMVITVAGAAGLWLRIPNYNLQRCHESDSLFEQVKPITVRLSLKSLSFRLWDEEGKRLIGYAGLRQWKVNGESDAPALSRLNPRAGGAQPLSGFSE